MVSWLSISTVHVWQEVALLHLLMEFVLIGAKAGSLLDVIPFLGALSVTVGPPLSQGVRVVNLSSDAHRVSGWLSIFAIHVGEEVSLLHFLMELSLVGAESGCLFNVVPFLRALSISVGPPLGHRVWLAELSCDTHWVTSWLAILAVHVWKEVSLFHFLMELILISAEPGSFLYVVPLLGALSVAVCPPLCQVILIVLTYLCGYSHWMVLWLGIVMIPRGELSTWLWSIVIPLPALSSGCLSVLVVIQMPPIVKLLRAVAISIGPLTIQTGGLSIEPLILRSLLSESRSHWMGVRLRVAVIIRRSSWQSIISPPRSIEVLFDIFLLKMRNFLGRRVRFFIVLFLGSAVAKSNSLDRCAQEHGDHHDISLLQHVCLFNIHRFIIIMRTIFSKN